MRLILRSGVSGVVAVFSEDGEWLDIYHRYTSLAPRLVVLARLPRNSEMTFESFGKAARSSVNNAGFVSMVPMSVIRLPL